MRAFCHACKTTFRTSVGGPIRCPRCARVINLDTFDNIFDGPRESAYFGWSEDPPRRRRPALDESTLAQAAAAVGNAASQLFRSVVQRVVRPPGEAVAGRQDREPPASGEAAQEQEHGHYTDDLWLN
jgi:hypothetical protein